MGDIQRIRELITTLNSASDAYYNSEPIISDYDWDKMYEELQLLEKETGIIYSNSPTQNVGFAVADKLKEVPHNHLMLSLDKTKQINGLIDFAGNKACILSVKCDGCFEKNTRILMSDGSQKRISDINIGDYVKSYNVEKNIIEDKKVINVFNNGLKEYRDWSRIYTKDKLNFGSSNLSHTKIICTNNHKFYNNNNWTEVNNLNINDCIYKIYYKLSQFQNDFILGALLGDGWLVKRSKNNNIYEIHYSKTKNNNYDCMINYANDLFKFKEPKITYRKSGYNSNIADINLHTIEFDKNYITNDSILRCGLTFTKEVCDYLTPLALAIFYIDDGSKNACTDDGYTNTPNKRVRCDLAVNRHSLESVKIFSKWLNDNGFYNSYVFEKEIKTPNYGCGYKITLTADGTEKFFDTIAKYIPYELRKIKLGSKEKWQNCELVEWWKDAETFNLKEVPISSIEKGFNKRTRSRGLKYRRTYIESYDLEVEDNHNYFAEGILVHNCSTTLHYLDGKLVSARTRGTGDKGYNCYNNVLTIKNVPKEISYKDELIIDGETIIGWDTFQKINDSLTGKKYEHPRNLVSGSLTMLDSREAAKRDMRFVAWRVIKGFEHKSVFEDLVEAEKNGFEVVPMWTYVNNSSDKENLPKMLENLQNVADEKNIPYDGAVLAIDNYKLAESMGRTDKFFRHSISYKYEDKLYDTKLLDIEWNTSKSGLINPVAVFEPVNLDGAVTTRATLHNVTYIKNMMLGVGDRIRIYRSNKVIPKVHDSIDKSGNFKIPSTCPVCGGKTKLVKENDSAILMCTNPTCVGKLLGRLSHAVSRNALDISGLSEATIDKFISLGWLKSIKDIYHLKDYELRMKNLEGFGSKSVTKLLDSIEKSRKTTLDKFLYSLSVPLLGKTASKAIAQAEDYNFNSFIQDMIHPGAEFFRHIPGIGDSLVNSLNQYFSRDCYEIYTLAEEFEFQKPEPLFDMFNERAVDLTGKTFVVTGSLEHFSNREEAKAQIESLGGKVSSSVSAKTSYLVNNDPNSTSSKNVKAKKLNVPIISEQELLSMIS